MSGPLDIVPTQLAEHVEAVVREAVSNAVRHAEAATLSVSIAMKDDLIRVVVVDDGKGLPENVSPSGLGNLGDRAAAMGGPTLCRRRPEAGVVGPVG
jgi:two-component system sensor histidine kinase DevS